MNRQSNIYTVYRNGNEYIYTHHQRFESEHELVFLRAQQFGEMEKSVNALRSWIDQVQIDWNVRWV